MSKSSDNNSCQTICWLLSGLAGLCVAAIVGIATGGIIAAIAGVLVLLGCGAFLQRHVCGLALDDWGPFEGLKGVPGWDEDGPHDPPAEAPKQTAAPDAQIAPEHRAARSEQPPSTLLAGEEALAAKKGEWRYQP